MKRNTAKEKKKENKKFPYKKTRSTKIKDGDATPTFKR